MTVALEGFHAVKHALRFAPELVREVTVTHLSAALALADELAPDLHDLLKTKAVEGRVDHPTGVGGLADRPVEDRSVLRTRSAPLVLLDDPKHPGNAGAAIRVAAAAGASGLALTGMLDPWHPSVVRGAAGLHYALPVLRCDIGELTGPLWALDADGDPLGELPDDVVLAVGSERSGLSQQVLAAATRVVSLPMRPGVSSLNLATAVSAALYSWRLRR